MSKINQLTEILKSHRIIIQTHNFPDPDAIACAYGLQYLLQHFGIDALICYDGVIDKISSIHMLENFDIDITNYKNIEKISDADRIIIVDGQKNNKNLTDLAGDEVICIDHHPVTVKNDYLFEDIRMTGACSTIIAEYYLEAGVVPPVNVATALIYGIKMDTSDFSRGVTELDAKMYYNFFNYADHILLRKLQLSTIEFSDLRAYSEAIKSIDVSNSLGFACLPFDCPDGLIAIISDFILTLDIVEISVVYSIRQDGYKFSVRSEISELDAGIIVSKALESIGFGGGHTVMAGGFIPRRELEKLGNNPHEALKNRFFKAAFI
jgi:nanoRNase/pAp phosphatase (c-di-AMP/oligoRNAs hydrolase)